MKTQEEIFERCRQLNAELEGVNITIEQHPMGDCDFMIKRFWLYRFDGQNLFDRKVLFSQLADLKKVVIDDIDKLSEMLDPGKKL